ncbi:4-hydroxythreonine-4-phosphate dehydrogenase [Campylobacter sp. VTCC 70190]|uniref:4-hydroxythreonine-4-phosphate dehydrogenase n=1 Tax=Campylobacter sp. VTCC 70190 TaxID=3392118 RepID=UPI00398F7C16
MKKLAISIGDINGIGLELLVRSHKELCKSCEPYYFLHENLLHQGLRLLNLELENANLVFFKRSLNYAFKEIRPKVFEFNAPLSFEVENDFDIKAGKIDAKSGLYAFLSFEAATHFVATCHANALITLPIHKKAWQLGGVAFKGHTHFLGHFFKKEAIMMLGCKELFVGLFTEHIPLNSVSKRIEFKALSRFLIHFHLQSGFKKIGLLGFNPHASDYGVIGGKEEKIMQKALDFANAFLAFLRSKKSVQNAFLTELKLPFKSLLERALKDEKIAQALLLAFKADKPYLSEILIADTAFTKTSLKNCKRLVAMYHDLALAPLKALYFEKSINVSLNLPIIRTSVDHGTAFDKAYKNAKISTKSYLEAVRFALKMTNPPPLAHSTKFKFNQT